MSQREIFAIVIIGIVVTVGGALAIKQHYWPSEVPLPAQQPTQDEPKAKPSEKTQQDEPQDTEKPSLESPILLFIEQAQNKAKSSEGQIAKQSIPLLSWDILNDDAPKKSVTFEGEIINIEIDDNHIIRIDSANGTKPNTHAYFTIEGKEFQSAIYPKSGNFLYFYASPNNNATAIVDVMPQEPLSVTIHTHEETIELVPQDIPSPESLSWNSLIPLGFSLDGNTLFLLAEHTENNKTQANGIYEYSLDTKEMKEIVTQENIEQKQTVTIVQNSVSSNTLILERQKKGETSLQAYNSQTSEYTLLIPANDYHNKQIEHSHLIGPNSTHILLYDEEEEQYVLYNTTEQTSTPWNNDAQPIGWLSKDTILAKQDTTFFLYDQNLEEIDQKEIPQLKDDKELHILDILFPIR